jgi:hypothetical protein
MAHLPKRSNRDLAIAVSALISDALHYDGYLGKNDSQLIFDALAEGLIQQDVPSALLEDIEALLMTRIDEPGELYNNSDRAYGPEEEQ